MQVEYEEERRGGADTHLLEDLLKVCDERVEVLLDGATNRVRELARFHELYELMIRNGTPSMNKPRTHIELLNELVSCKLGVHAEPLGSVHHLDRAVLEAYPCI
jgi:hypothetical protein